MTFKNIKNLTQIVDEEGTALPAETNPDFFLNDANIYAPVWYNNKVDFFTTGEKYYTRLGEVIDKAKKSVFITGWQINYDIPLDKIDNPNGATAKHKANREKYIEKVKSLDETIAFYREKQRLAGGRGYEEYIENLEFEKKRAQQAVDSYEKQWISASRIHRTLWQCLRSAVERGVKVYVMPWLSLPYPSDLYTRCFETTLAVFQLNSGLPEQRAFCIPSKQLSDMGALGGSFFSHHQKSVIVDNEIAYVGGLDLAYGRRDDEMFRLNCADRHGEDRYNNCIPAIDEATTDDAVTVIGLMLSTFFDTDTPARFINAYATVSDINTRISNWWSTPLTPTPLLWLKDALNTSKKIRDDVIDDAMKEFLKMMLLLIKLVHQEESQAVAEPQVGNVKAGLNNALDQLNITKESIIGGTTQVLQKTAEVVGLPTQTDNSAPTNSTTTTNIRGTLFGKPVTVDRPAASSTVTNQTRTEINAQTLKKLQTVWTKIANDTATREDYIEILPIVLDWLQTADYARYAAVLVNLTINNIPSTNEAVAEQALTHGKEVMDTMLWYIYAIFQKRALQQKEPYYYLAKKPQPLFPKSGKKLKASAQPRMPWHDVQVEIQGEAVYDLARNFIERWNTGQQWLESVKQPADLPIVQTVMKWAVCLYEENVNQTVKDMLSWTGDRVNQLDMVKQLTTGLAVEPPAPHYISGDLLPPEAKKIVAKEGYDAIVQILRSASTTMVKAEQVAEQSAAKYTNDPQVKMGTGPHNTYVNKVQDNCQQAWLKAIKGSQHFLYIETQFFQSIFGAEFGYPINHTSVSGPMAQLERINPKYSYYLEQINLKKALVTGNYRDIDWNQLAEIAVDTREEGLISELFNEIFKAFKAKATGVVTEVGFRDRAGDDPQLKNKIVEAMVARVKKAIQEKRPYHIYLVVPVHPEGSLKSNTLMYQVHLTMQTISFGTNSLIKSIQREIYIQKQIDLLKAETKEEIQAIYDDVAEIERRGTTKPPYIDEKGWTDYLTLLNLRSWEELNGMPTTEQIYIHSKLIIADDNVAVIGSCNVNDRSMTGDRDSELAAIIKGKKQKIITINGQDRFAVSEVVHNFRVDLWKKIFGLAMPKPHPHIKPAKTLQDVLLQPAAPSTWDAIQQIATDNMNRYNAAFQFIPQNISHVQVGKKAQVVPEGCDKDYPNQDKKFYPLRCSVWPTWVYEDPNSLSAAGDLDSVMPFDADFWLNPSLNNYTKRYLSEDPWYTKLKRTFSLKKYPDGVEGFIVTLPHEWTMGENNTSQIHLWAVAHNLNIDLPYGIDDPYSKMASLPSKQDSSDA